MSLQDTIAPVGATAILQAILNAVGQLKLVPLGHWTWDSNLAFTVTYVVSIGAAAIACLLPAQTNKRKALLIGFGLIIFVGSFLTYNWVFSSPPTLSTTLFYDFVGFISFFLTYASFGFFIGRVTLFFSTKPT
jgi:hypothetical protein